MEDPYDRSEDVQDFCEVCGDALSLGWPLGEGCPLCLPCGGQYAPGTEECDSCMYSDECEKDYIKRFQG